MNANSSQPDVFLLALALRVQALTKHFNGVKALDGVSLEVRAGEVVALIGPNGAGKTTLFNIITGFIAADGGQVQVNGNDVTHLRPHLMAKRGVARTFQNVRLIGGLTALDNVMLSFVGNPGEAIFTGLALRPRRVGEMEASYRIKARELLAEVGLEEKASDLARELSYGQQKLLTIACALAASPAILLLDEPVAGVNPDLIVQILELVRREAAKGRAIVLIEHNMQAVEEVAGRAIFMDAGRKIVEGTPSSVMADPRVLEAYLE